MFENFKRIFKRVKNQSHTFISARTSDEFILLKNNFGKVSTETAAIQKIVSRAAIEVEGIAEATCTVDAPVEKVPLKIRFSLKLEENFSVNDVSKSLVAAVRGNLEKIFGIIEVEIYVKVTDVTKSEPKPKRRVR